MKNKIITFFKGIKLYNTYYLSTIAVITSIWGIFTLYNDWVTLNSQLQSDVTKILNIQKHGNKIDSLLLIQQETMKRQLSDIQNTTSSLESSYVKYISNDKTLTKQDFLKYMNGLKFNGGSFTDNNYPFPYYQYIESFNE